MIRGITFSEQAFYSADFAHYQNFFLNRQNGITKGCEIEHDEKTVTIGTGYFIAHGRMMNVEEAEIVTAVQGFAEGYNRIVYEIDLSKENTIEQFNQGYIKVLQSEELVQEDLDADGQVYQMPFCHFQWNGTEISDFMIDAPTLVLDNIFADVSANFESVLGQIDDFIVDQKQEFGEYAEEKKAELDGVVSAAEEIIEELEADGFEKKAIYVSTELSAANWNTETKIYSFEETYPSDQYHIELEAVRRCTPEQQQAWAKAIPMGSDEENVLEAFGEVPTVDIPILLTVRKIGGGTDAEGE